MSRGLTDLIPPQVPPPPEISTLCIYTGTCTVRGPKSHAHTHTHIHTHRTQEQVLPLKVQEGYHSAIADLDKRVKTLEQQVQRLKDIAVNRGGPSGQVKQGNNFWYVLTFAGWMMVPLIVVYMYRYRR